MRINDRLNLVFKVDRDDGSAVHVHAMPISREVYEANYLVLAKAFSALYNHDLKWVSGPKVAALLIRDAMGTLPEGNSAVGLLPEIRRLTNVLIPTASGYEHVPFQDVVARKLLNEDEIADVEGKVCFFILVSTMHPRPMAIGIMEIAGGLWGTQTTSLTFTEYSISLMASASEEITTKPAVS